MEMSYDAVLLVTSNAKKLEEAVAPFRQDGFAVHTADTLDEALSLIDPAAPPALVLLDADGLDEIGLREWGMRVISCSALTWVTAVTAMDAETFHDAMEGLGMLPPLPKTPSRSDGEALLTALRRFVPKP